MQSAAATRMEGLAGIVIRSDVMRRLLVMVERVARGNAAVLIVGETGSGKEIVARILHQNSARSSKPFVDVNCAALPEHLVESELFGYEKGAFSGAESSKQGLFELADQGTLFLDEIGELDGRVQAKLLRVLDGAPFYRLGGNRKVEVNVRVIAATNRTLEDDVKSNRFRSDLFHRLAQFQLQVPPLRDRPDDIVALTEHFLEQHAPGIALDPEARRCLLKYSWPGNVRELRNAVFKASVRLPAGMRELRARDLPAEVCGTGAESPATSLDGTLEDMERRMILHAMSRTGGNGVQAAQQLGISERTLRRKLEKYRHEGSEADALGTMGPFQQRYFRVSAELPVLLKVDGSEFAGTISNLSSGGVAIQSSAEVPHGAVIEISFTLPGASAPIEGTAKLAWAAPGGLAGFSFAEMHPAVRQELQCWLRERAKLEGWIPAEPQ